MQPDSGSRTGQESAETIQTLQIPVQNETLAAPPPPGLYVGYVRLEEWAEVADRARPIYATRFITGVDAGSGIPEAHDLCLMVAQPDYSGCVHYWRFRAASMTMLYGRPFGDKAVHRQQAHDDAWYIVYRWLKEQGFEVRRALVGLPRDLRPFEGSADFLVWDHALQRYRRKVDDSTGEGG